MSQDLEDLVGFIGNPNPQIRQLAVENLLPYSTSQPAIFKTEGLKPIKNLAILLQDHPDISQHAISILINLSGENDVLEMLATNDRFTESVFSRLVNPEEPTANLLAMLMANLTKWDGFKNMLQKKQKAPESLSSSDVVLDQLMDLFVKGQDGAFNEMADFDYLAYVFADLSKHEEIRQYFLEAQKHDGIIPISKLKVFTEHKSYIRRKGVASTIKNVAFDVKSHPSLLSDSDVNILPYILLPITGNEEFDMEDSMDMLPDLQLLPPDKQRDPDSSNIQTHVETLMLLTTTREGRDLMRAVKVYPIIRETHLKVDDEGVKEVCDRLVQVLMRDEEGEESAESRIQEVVEDEEDQIVEV